MEVRCCVLIPAVLFLVTAASGQEPGRYALSPVTGTAASASRIFVPAVDAFGRPVTRSVPSQRYGHSLPDLSLSTPAANVARAAGAQPFSSDPALAPSAPSVCCEPICPTCCCDCSPCDESSRRYAVDVGSIFMFRSSPDGRQLFVNPAATTQHINAGAFDFGTTLGIDGGLILYEQHDLTDIELRATWVEEWADGLRQSFSGSTVQFQLNPTVGTTGPRIGGVVYGSQYFSSEVNVRFRSPANKRRSTIVAGFRILNLDEALDGTFLDPNGILPSEVIRVQTKNRLVGFQVGTDSVLKTGCNWCAKLKLRTGLYSNEGNQDTQLISLATPAVTFPSAGSGRSLAWHAEAGLKAVWRLSSCANMSVSWRIIYIDGLALASDQFATTSVLSGSGYNNDSAILLHGVTAGLEFTY